jgi:hypothetical protein
MRLGLRLLEMPPLTPYLGPILRPSTAKYGNRLGEEKDLLTGLLDQLPPFASFAQHLPPGFQNWLPFHWRGFSQGSHVTYIIPSLAELGTVWYETLDRVRTDIRKAEKTVTVADGATDDFLKLYQMTFARQSDTPHVPGETIRHAVEACLARSSGRLLVARDTSGRAHAGCFVAWDASSAYYLLGGADPELRNSGAGSLALWRAIQFVANLATSEQQAASGESSGGQAVGAVADGDSLPSASVSPVDNPASLQGRSAIRNQKSEIGNPSSPLPAPRSLSFDFEGSMVEGIERFVRAWGGRQTSYHAISKTPSRALRTYRALIRLTQ